MTKPDVSIIVAVYNAEDYIGRCLDSLIAQTYKNIEIICVNDASTDHSQEIIDSYKQKDERVRSIVHQQNMNAGGAMNDGIKAASGEYVCIVDNDDWLAANAIEKLLSASDNIDCDIVCCDWYDYKNENDYNQNKNLTDSVDRDENIIYGLLFGFRLLGALIRRSIFVSNDLFFPEKVFFEDNAIGLCILLYAKKIKPVHEALYYYFLSENSVTRSNSLKKFEDRVFTTELFLDNMQKRGFINERSKELIEYRYLRYSFSTLFRLKDYTGKGGYRIAKVVSKRIMSKMPNRYIRENCGGFEKSFQSPMTYYIKSKIVGTIKRLFSI